jgi:protease II
MDQARIISAATFSSRIAASEDSNELKENTIRDIATFSSFYFLGDYAAKGIATYLEKHNKYGIKLTNKLKKADENSNIFERFWNWAKHTKMKSTDELMHLSEKQFEHAKRMRAMCQLGNLAFSLLSLGVFIPLYTRTQTNRKK